MTTPPEPYKAYAYGLGTVLMWSTVATAFKLALNELQPVQLLFYASISSTLTLALIVLIQRKGHLLKESLNWQRSVGLGFLNPFLYYVVLFAAYDQLPAQEAQPLNYTWALSLSFLSVPLLKQRLSRWDVLSSLIAYSGVFVIATRGHINSLSFQNPWGVTLALGSTLIWALYWIANMKDKRDPVVALFLSFVCSLPMTGLLFWGLGYGLSATWTGLAAALYIGIFEMGLAFVLWIQALKFAENTSRVSNLIFISPFLSLVLIAFVLGERILVSTYWGLGLIVVGLGVQSFFAQKSEV